MKQAIKYLGLFMSITLCFSSIHAFAARQGSNVQDEFRKVWADHSFWSKSYIVSEMEGLDDREAVLKRLLKNQEDIGVSLSSYLDEKVTDQVTVLLKEHILIAGKIILAAKSGKKDTFESEQKKWHENADKIASLLSTAHPEWQEKTLKEMLFKHLEHMTNNISARIIRDWEADIASADEGFSHMQKFADYLSEKI